MIVRDVLSLWCKTPNKNKIKNNTGTTCVIFIVVFTNWHLISFEDYFLVGVWFGSFLGEWSLSKTVPWITSAALIFTNKVTTWVAILFLHTTGCTEIHHIQTHQLGCPHSPDASGKWSFTGFRIQKITKKITITERVNPTYPDSIRPMFPLKPRHVKSSY